MNAVTNRAAGAIAALSSLKQGLANVAATIPVTSGDFYLRMEKDGTWVYGPENIEVEKGSLWAVNPFSFKHGYVCWTNYPKPERGPQPKNEKLGERMVPMTTTKPPRESLEEVRDDKLDRVWEWKDQTSCQLKCTNGSDKGEQVLYNVSSVGGSNEMAELVAAIMAQLNTDPDHPVPLVELTFDSYPHKTYGKIYTPVLEIKGWLPLEENVDAAVAGVQPVSAPEPVRQPEPKEEPAKAVRQRRAAPKDEGPKATEELAQAIETPAERRARLLRELEEMDGGEQTMAATPEQIEAAAQQAENSGGETRRRRRVS